MIRALTVEAGSTIGSRYPVALAALVPSDKLPLPQSASVFIAEGTVRNLGCREFLVQLIPVYSFVDWGRIVVEYASVRI